MVKFCKPTNVTTIDVPIAMTTPAAMTATLDSNIFRSATRSDAAVARIGVISGATSIAPMITATLFAASPKAARRVDKHDEDEESHEVCRELLGLPEQLVRHQMALVFGHHAT